MAGTAQQLFILNQELRAPAKMLAQTYYRCKMASIQAAAGQWPNQFPNDTTVIDDGTSGGNNSSDGRAVVQGNHIRDLLTEINDFIAYAEGTSPVESPSPLSKWLKIAVLPEQV